MRDKIVSTSSLLGRLWLFPAAYLLHIVEETWGVGVPHGINLSLAQFFVLSGAAWALLVVGVVLARRFGFSQFLQVCLATVFLANGFSHIVNSAVFAGYDAGVITGALVFIPLGALTLFTLRKEMARRRYFVAVAAGLLMQAVATVLAM
jgi:hypothetical protein